MMCKTSSSSSSVVQDHFSVNKNNNKLFNLLLYVLLQSEFEKRARAMADGDEEPLTENEKHALRNSTVTEDGRHVCGKTRRAVGQPMI